MARCKPCNRASFVNPTGCSGCRGPISHKHVKLCQACHGRAKRGMKNQNWKGGRSIKDGYVWLSGYFDHPNARGGKIAEHWLVITEALGRPLRPCERVHHINGIRDDNRIENLELWSTNQPSGQRVEDKLSWAREFIQTYHPEWLRD